MNIKMMGVVEGISEAACDKHREEYAVSMWLRESSQYEHNCVTAV